MLDATVPEATIDENSDLCAWEHDVGTSAEVHEGSRVNAVSQAANVKQRPQRELFGGVSAGYSLHALAYRDG